MSTEPKDTWEHKCLVGTPRVISVPFFLLKTISHSTDHNRSLGVTSILSRESEVVGGLLIRRFGQIGDQNAGFFI